MKKLKKSPQNIVALLTTAALTLPGIQQVKADAPIDHVRADTKFTHYEEAGKRYKIDTYQTKFDIPINDEWQLTLKLDEDLMTGASERAPVPDSFYYFLANNPNPGNPAIIRYNDFLQLTGATIADKRQAIDATATYYFPETVVAFGAGYSTEHDYEARYAHLELRKPYNKKNTEVSFSIGFSSDKVTPVTYNSAVPIPPRDLHASGNKSTLTLVGGVRQDLSAKTSIQGLVGYSQDRGYLGDPYRLVAIIGDSTLVRPGSAFFPDLAAFGLPLNIPAGVSADYDRRPNIKEERTYLLRLVHYVETLNSSIHFDYRFAYDNWGIDSNMLEMSYFQPIANKWMITPTVRYYSQSEARFYAPLFIMPNTAFGLPLKPLPVPIENSTDYRLGKFGVVSGQLEIAKRFTPNVQIGVVGGINMRKECYYWGTAPDFSNPNNNYNSPYVSVNALIDFEKK